MMVQETPALGWDRFGPLGAYASRFLCVLARLLWLTSHPANNVCTLPCGWLHGEVPEVVALEFGEVEAVRGVLEQAFCGEAEGFLAWLTANLPAAESAFEMAAVMCDVEELQEFFDQRKKKHRATRQMALL
jgi:hypothetical protein